MIIAFICTKCGKAHYNVQDVKPIENELFICSESFECKGRELRQFGKNKFKKNNRFG